MRDAEYNRRYSVIVVTIVIIVGVIFSLLLVFVTLALVRCRCCRRCVRGERMRIRDVWDSIMISIHIATVLVEGLARHRTEESRRVYSEFSLEFHECLRGAVSKESGNEAWREDRRVVRERDLELLHVITVISVVEIPMEVETCSRR